MESRNSSQSSINAAIVWRNSDTKRIFDMTLSMILFICCLPLFMTLPILILIFSGRPIFFRQIRTGVNGKPFLIWKFRTMHQTTNEKERHCVEWQNGVPDEFVFKEEHDSAVTPIGRILRKYSLDELPQLLNVMTGEMSLVGPRPEIPVITDQYNSYQKKRLLVKPGITGYAQVNGRSEINHGKKIEFDLYYVENSTFLLDLKIILMTILYVFTGKGAY